MPARKSTSVPKAMQSAYDDIVAITDAFCRDHLNAEYGELARSMAAALSRKRPSPLSSGQARTWACGIVHALGQINFLSDRSSEPFMTTAALCSGFGVNANTATGKAKAVRTALGTHRMDPTWMLRRLADRNPLVWMAEVNGLLVDLRTMPRDVQEIAFEKGMIPYIPVDQEP